MESSSIINTEITRNIQVKPNHTKNETKKTTRSGYHCHLCGKTYKLRDNYNRHYVSCEFFHKKCLETNDEFNESIDIVPTQKEMYNFIKEIALKCRRLEEEVSHLKRYLNVRQKQNIMDILNNDPKNASRTPIHLWCSEIHVHYEHLEEVFRGSLLSGIKAVIKPHLSCDNVPLKSFREKNTLYIYDSDRTWKVAPSSCFENLIHSLEKQFLKIFLEWQKENQERISRSEQLKDDEIQYMMKICGYKSHGDKHALIKKWIISEVLCD